MYKRPRYIAVTLVVVLALLVLNLPSSATAHLKLALGSIFIPLFGLASGTQHLAAKASDALVPRRELIQEIELLRSKNEQLTLQAEQAEAIYHENDRLRALYGWQRQAHWQLKLAHVILRDPANWWRTVEIDLGSRDGLRENLPVLTTDGLVGRVSAVSYTNARVVLIGDRDCKVSAMILGDARGVDGNAGVITVGGQFDGSLVRMQFLPRDANIKPGQSVVTSGMGGLFPKGIPVGKVVDPRSTEDGLAMEADVKLSANLGALEEVWVMFPNDTAPQ
jgi:rod shape-determining protein MreC